MVNHYCRVRLRTLQKPISQQRVWRSLHRRGPVLLPTQEQHCVLHAQLLAPRHRLRCPVQAATTSRSALRTSAHAAPWTCAWRTLPRCPWPPLAPRALRPPQQSYAASWLRTTTGGSLTGLPGRRGRLQQPLGAADTELPPGPQPIGAAGTELPPGPLAASCSSEAGTWGSPTRLTQCQHKHGPYLPALQSRSMRHPLVPFYDNVDLMR